MIDAPVFTISAVKFIKHEVGKCSLDNAKMEESFYKLVAEIDDKGIKIKDRILTKRIRAVRSTSRPTYIPDDKKASPKSYSTAKSLDESNTRRYRTGRQDKRSRRHRTRRHHRFHRSRTHMQTHPESGLRFLVPVNERCHEATD